MRKLIVTIAITLFVLPCFAKTYGPTKSTDHLWRIAVTTRPNKTVSVQQTMIAIWRANPKAFNNGNINFVKSGHYLQIPPLAKIKAISSYAAIREVNRQNTIWLKTPQKKVYSKKTSSKKTHKKFHMPVRKHAAQGGLISKIVKLQHKNQQTLAMLEQQIKASNQVMVVMQQKAHMQLAQLQHNNSTFKAQLQQQLQPINEQMQNLKDQVQQLELITKQRYEYWLISLIAIAVLFLILIISLSSCRRKQKKNKTSNPEPTPTKEELKPEPEAKESEAKESETKEPETKESDTKDTDTEYDFLGSEEGIPAKLDLAQTYIDMEDKDAAAKVLKEIIQKGNAEQTKEAADLLRQIK